MAADAFRRDIRFTQAHGVSAHTLGRIDFNTEGLARTEHVVLRKAGRQNHAVGRGVTGTKRNGARRTFLHIDFQVNLITRAFHRLGFGSHRIKVAQTINTISRNFYLLAVKPCGLVLTNFTTNDVVAGTGIAGDIDVTHISATPRVNRQHNIDSVLAFNRNGVGRNGCKGIAQS